MGSNPAGRATNSCYISGGYDKIVATSLFLFRSIPGDSRKLRAAPVPIALPIKGLQPENPTSWSFSRVPINGLGRLTSTRFSFQKRQRVGLAGIVGGDKLHRID